MKNVEVHRGSLISGFYSTLYGNHNAICLSELTLTKALYVSTMFYYIR